MSGKEFNPNHGPIYRYMRTKDKRKRFASVHRQVILRLRKISITQRGD